MINHIFVDLDDVLCDLVGAVLDLIGRGGALRHWPPGEWDIPTALGMSEDDVWGRVRREGADFWANLHFCWYAQSLVDHIGATGLPWTILSSPRIGPECAAGKIRWIERRLPMGKPYILTAEKHLLAGPGRLLIDDCDANCDAWEAAGGTAILFPRQWNRNHELAGNSLQYTTDALKRLTQQTEDGVEVRNDGLPSEVIRRFETGATRDAEDGKLDYEGFLSPHALERYAAYLNRHRVQTDGALRASDNWQKGLPLDTYMKSAWRHLVSWWKLHRGGSVTDERDGRAVDAEEAICGLLFNAMGYLHELLKKKEAA